MAMSPSGGYFLCGVFFKCTMSYLKQTNGYILKHLQPHNFFLNSLQSIRQYTELGRRGIHTREVVYEDSARRVLAMGEDLLCLVVRSLVSTILIIVH